MSGAAATPFFVSHLRISPMPAPEGIERSTADDAAAATSGGSAGPGRKRARPRGAEREAPAAEADGNAPKKPRLLALARQRLSKWAARLFDPDRPKGLIEAPEILPLDDTFLQAFGRREKERDSLHGVEPLRIETADDDSISVEKQDASDARLSPSAADPAGAAAGTPAGPTEGAGSSLVKLKIANLKFTTTEETLEAACARFGEVQNLVLVMDDENDKLNKGRAYCTYTSKAAAQACMEQLTELDGRRLRITAATQATGTPAGGGSTRATGAAGGASSRYYFQDITTKCFRCGQIGHYADDCGNEPLAKPCPLCGRTNHGLRDCPSRQVCFNCGVPGHVAGQCPLPRGQPQRRICTVCRGSGHSKEYCRQPAPVGGHDPEAAQYATCMVCGSLGHLMCRDMQWYFGLRGISCYNCGRVGHVGRFCDRPRSEECFRNDDVGVAEVERAAAWNTAEDEIDRSQQRRRPGRESHRQPQDDRGRSQQRPQHNRFQNDTMDKRRNQSLPPPTRGRTEQNYNNRGHHGQSTSGRATPDRESSGRSSGQWTANALDQPLKSRRH